MTAAGYGPLTTKDGQPVTHGLNTGAFAEYAVVDASQAVAIPTDIPFASASLPNGAFRLGVSGLDDRLEPAQKDRNAVHVLRVDDDGGNALEERDAKQRRGDETACPHDHTNCAETFILDTDGSGGPSAGDTFTLLDNGT